MKKHHEVTLITKNSLIQAFCILYMKKPIEKISIKELTDIAGYNRGTFYNHFEDIYDLLKHLEDSAIIKIKNSILENINRDNAKQKFIDLFIKMCEKWEYYINVLLNGQDSPHFIERLKKEIFYTCMSVFNLPENNIKASYILDFYLSAILSILSRWVKNHEDMSSSDVGELLKDMLLNGVSSKIDVYGKKIQKRGG